MKFIHRLYVAFVVLFGFGIQEMLSMIGRAIVRRFRPVRMREHYRGDR